MTSTEVMYIKGTSTLTARARELPIVLDWREGEKYQGSDGVSVTLYG